MAIKIGFAYSSVSGELGGNWIGSPNTKLLFLAFLAFFEGVT